MLASLSILLLLLLLKQPFGFPEPLRSRVIAGKKLPNGKEFYDGRPGAEMAPFDFDAAAVKLKQKFGPNKIKETHLYVYIFNKEKSI